MCDFIWYVGILLQCQNEGISMDKTRKCKNHHPGRGRSHGCSTDRPTDQWSNGAQSRYRLLIQLHIVFVSWSNVQGVRCGDIHAGRYNVASVFFVGQTTQASAVNGDQPPGKSTSNRCRICLNVINLKHELFLSNLWQVTLSCFRFYQPHDGPRIYSPLPPAQPDKCPGGWGRGHAAGTRGCGRPQTAHHTGNLTPSYRSTPVKAEHANSKNLSFMLTPISPLDICKFRRIDDNVLSTLVVKLFLLYPSLPFPMNILS